MPIYTFPVVQQNAHLSALLPTLGITTWKLPPRQANVLSYLHFHFAGFSGG